MKNKEERTAIKDAYKFFLTTKDYKAWAASDKIMSPLGAYKAWLSTIEEDRIKAERDRYIDNVCG